MLKPRYIEELPETMIALYSQVEMDILADMARRINTYDYYIPSVQWQQRKLVEMGNYHSFVTKALASRTAMTEKEIERLMEEAGTKAIAFDDAVYQRMGLHPPPLAASPALLAVLETGKRNTKGLFQNLCQTTANQSGKQFTNALDRAYLQILSGAFDRNTAVKMAVKNLAKEGVGAVEYPSGRRDILEVAVRRAVVTGVNQTCLKLQEMRADEMGCDLVETTAHGGARPDHAKWQGKVFSRSGMSRQYEDFVSTTGYGTGAGLGGWNCRHSFYPYYEGDSPTYSQEMLDDYQAKKYRYNGQQLTEYEASQKQRYIERQIRRWKRENVAMNAVGQETGESASKIAYWQGKQRDFIKQTGLKRQYDRERVQKVVTGGQNSGIISMNAGALNPMSPQAERHAAQYYESVRHMKGDVARIAENVGWKPEAIGKIKNHVFIQEHDLLIGRQRFDPSYDMAQSWQRLIEGKHIKEQDIVLLKHEYLELTLMKSGYTQDEAHTLASKRHNFAKFLD